jgi:hypothetical protein
MAVVLMFILGGLNVCAGNHNPSVLLCARPLSHSLPNGHLDLKSIRLVSYTLTVLALQVETLLHLMKKAFKELSVSLNQNFVLRLYVYIVFTVVFHEALQP